MVNPAVDDLSMMTYLSAFPKAKLKPGAPLRPKSNAKKVQNVCKKPFIVRMKVWRFEIQHGKDQLSDTAHRNEDWVKKVELTWSIVNIVARVRRLNVNYFETIPKFGILLKPEGTEKEWYTI